MRSRIAKWLALASIALLLAMSIPAAAPSAQVLRLSRAEYEDRAQAVWTAQIVAALLTWPFEHRTASTLWIDQYPRQWTNAPVDDDWYYEMCALRGFEKHGIGMTAGQLGEQWKENACGSWGSSEQARLLLARGLVLRRTLKLSEKPALNFQVGADAGRAWELNVYANNKLMHKRIIEGGTNARQWQEVRVDLSAFAGETVHLRLYQRVLAPNRVAGNAYWKSLRLE